MSKSFTIIEFIFVITISSILLISSFDFIRPSLELSHHVNNSYYKQLKIQNSIEQIKRMLALRVPNTFEQLDSTKYQFIGSEYDSFLGYFDTEIHENIGHSRYIDLDSASTSKSVAHTVGSNLQNAYYAIKDTTSANLKKPKYVAMIFENNPTKQWTVHCLDGDCTDKLQFDDSSAKSINSHYYLSGSAYTLEFSNNLIYLYRQYKPWKNQTYKKGKKFILVDHVDEFTIKKIDNNLEINICIYQQCNKIKI